MDVSSLTSSLVKILQTLSTFLAALHITDPVWPPGAEVDDGTTFDFIVVGAGTAGSIVATRLAEVAECSVLLIEAGGNPPLSSVVSGAFPLMVYSEYDWKYKSEPADNIAQGKMEKALNLTAGKMLGGTSALNHLIYVRGFAADYDKWAETVNDDSWNYDNIFKYLLKTEHLKDKAILNSEFVKYHGTNGTIGTATEPQPSLPKYLNAYKDVGYDTLVDSANNKLAFSNMLFMITENVRQGSTAKSYLIDEIEKKKRKNVSILKNTLVTKVLFDDDNVAIGVTALTQDDKEVTFKARKEVILSAGTFNSPKILLLSGVGPKEDLENFNIPVVADLPVGENYQDHPTLFLVQKVRPLLVDAPPNLLEFPFPSINGFVAFNKSQTYPDYQQLSFVMNNKLLFSILCTVVFSYSDSVCDSMLRETAGYEALLMVPTFVQPKSRGKVSLRSIDPKDAPIIKTGLLTEEDDVEMLVNAIEDSLRIENSTFYKKYDGKVIEIDLPECKQYTFRSRDYWRCYVKYMGMSCFHYASSNSMGLVVDSSLKVMGVKNLRVVDASVMPYITSGKIEVPVLVIAEKAADMIKATYGYGTTEETTAGDDNTSSDECSNNAGDDNDDDMSGD